MPAGTSELGYEHLLERGTSGETLLVLHATGGDEQQLAGLARELAPAATLLAPRGKVMENGVTRRFFARRSMTELDVPDLLRRTDELADFVAAAAGAYELDPARVTALGYSNGANIAASMLLRRPGVLKGAALLRATLPYEPESSPALAGTRVLIATGASDPYVLPGAAERLAEILRAGGADVSERVADAGHELTAGDLEVAREWLAGAR
jgi:predicted esterase